MDNNVLCDSEQLRAIGVAMVTGSQGLELVADNYFQVVNDRIVGCCALGGVLLSVRPELLCEQVSYDFGATLEDQSEVQAELLARFPVLESTVHNSAFLNACCKQLGSSNVELDVDLSASLFNVIAAVFDSSAAGTDNIQASLNLVADQMNVASVPA